MTLATCHFFERIYKEATPVVRFVRNGPDLIIEVGGGARGDGGYISPEAAGCKIREETGSVSFYVKAHAQ